MATKRVVFIRPGETEWNKIGRWQGIVAVPLNAHGRAQAERLSQFVRNIGLDVIYASDLRRAKDTAEIIAEKSGAKLVYDQRLRERSMGEWQGLTLNEIRAWYPDDYARIQSDPEGYQVPAGESRRQVAHRVRACFDDIVARGGNTIGVISHTTAIRSLLADLVPNSDPYNMNFRNMSVTTIAQNEDGTWLISQLDDVTHLEGISSETFGEIEQEKKA